MPSNAFNAPNQTAGPPSICKTRIPPLIPIIPGAAPPTIHGYIKIVDAAPPDPVNIAMYIPMNATAGGFNFEGTRTASGFQVTLALYRVIDPQPYQIRLTWQRPGDPPAVWSWFPIVVEWEPPFDSGLLTHIYVPQYDYQTARVTQ